MNALKRISIPLVSYALLLGCLQAGCASEESRAQPAPLEGPPSLQVPQQSAAELEQLVAPIALYPDALVAQILAAASHPTQIVEADRWLQQQTTAKGAALAQAVDRQPWDPGVKALTQVPELLAMMDKNLSWTSSLGEAYVNAQANVLDAVQRMRRRAQQAGNLKSTPEESVKTEGSTILIEPTDPQIVYVPEYDPWIVYGDPIAFYPGWVGYPGFFLEGPGIEFGVGIGIGFFGGFGWGWHHWGTDWHGHDLIHGDRPYYSHSREFGDRDGHGDVHGGFGHPGGIAHGGSFAHAGAGWATRESGLSGVHSGAFSGFNHGGEVRNFAARGRASFGGGLHAGGLDGGGGHR